VFHDFTRRAAEILRALPLFASLAAAAVGTAQAQPQLPTPVHQERGNLILEGIPSLDPALAERVERYLHTRQASFVDWLPDGGMLITTRFGEVDQIHRLTAPLGMREELTFFPEPVTVARAPQVPGAEGFVFLKDHGGDENSQLFYYRLADHSARLLTDGKSLHGSVVWSKDGKRIAFVRGDSPTDVALIQDLKK